MVQKLVALLAVQMGLPKVVEMVEKLVFQSVVMSGLYLAERKVES